MTKNLVLLVCLVVACGCGDTRIQDNLEWASDTLWGTFALLADPDSQPGSSEGLLVPRYVRHAAGLGFVADAGRDQVAVVDLDGSVRSWIGSPGRGPGELMGVSRVATRGARILVAEARNGRVSEFAVNGRFVRAFVAPLATGALVATDDQVIIAAKSATHHGASLRQGAPPRPILRRARRAIAGDAGGSLSHDLIAADDRHLWVFDQATGALCSFGHDGSAQQCLVLPAGLLERLRTYRDARVAALEKGAGVRVTAAPLAKDMLFAGEALAILLPLPELPALLVNPTDGTLTPVLHRSDSLPAWARRATGFSWDGHSLLLVSDEGIGRLSLTTF